MAFFKYYSLFCRGIITCIIVVQSVVHWEKAYREVTKMAEQPIEVTVFGLDMPARVGG